MWSLKKSFKSPLKLLQFLVWTLQSSGWGLGKSNALSRVEPIYPVGSVIHLLNIWGLYYRGIVLSSFHLLRVSSTDSEVKTDTEYWARLQISSLCLTGYYLEVHSCDPHLEFAFANKQHNCKRLVCSTVFIEIVPFEKWNIVHDL